MGLRMRDWVKWDGRGNAPVDSNGVEVRQRNGHVSTQYVHNVKWEHSQSPFDVVAYRLPTAPPNDVQELVERLNDKHFLDDESKARLPEPAADIIYLFRRERAEAADTLAALSARNAVLEKALEPFAEYLDTAKFDLDNKGDPLPDDQGMGWVYLTVGDFRRARAALSPIPAEPR